MGLTWLKNERWILEWWKQNLLKKINWKLAEVDSNIGVFQNGFKMAEQIIKEGNNEVQAQIPKKSFELQCITTRQHEGVYWCKEKIRTLFWDTWTWTEKMKFDSKSLDCFCIIRLYCCFWKLCFIYLGWLILVWFFFWKLPERKKY